ncbi:hypothetical protein FKM82_002931 [Ascaphus truei]
MSYPSEVSPVRAGPPVLCAPVLPSTQRANVPQAPQGITIQLTTAQSEDWENLDDTELIFSLDQDDDAGAASTTENAISPGDVQSAGHLGIGMNELALAPYERVGDVLLCNDTQRSSFPLLPISPTSKPLITLVKSLSTEIDSKDSSALKPHPLVNLVKSISTEISRLEPEVTQSKSDSKLNVHLWRQITQTKNRNGDSRTAPSSPSMSPSESKGGFFNVQDVEARLEDTKRRLSEAMQEPLSMLSKIIGEETSATPKYRTMDSCQTQPHHDVPCRALVCVAILAYNFFIWPLPSYVSGLFLGLASGFLLGFFVILLLVPNTTYSSRQTRFLQEKLKTHLAAAKSQEPDVLRGWMNEVCLYDPETYHPALTHSVFVTLEGTTLKRSYPKTNVPRRSTFGEEIPEAVFISHQINDLTNAQVFLYPHGLARKRIWNKKYPICIQLYDTDELSSTSSDSCDTEAVTGEAVRLTPENTPKPLGEFKAGTLYMFGRTGREKEEWCQQLVRASRGSVSGKQSASRNECKTGFLTNLLSSPCSWGAPSNSSGGSTEDIPCLFRHRDLAGNVRQKILLDYTAYMSRFIPVEQGSPLPSPCQSAASSPTPRKKHLVERSLSTNPHVCWINALIGRIFWDFLREKYWEDLVANKIQKKLSKIKLPHFMNELTLTDLDMGTSLPQILCTLAPTMNERGLWMDLDISYSGSLQVTLETKMNLSKLGKEAPLEENAQAEDRRKGTRTPRARILADSDEESSSAGSSEDEETPITETPGAVGDKLNPTNAEGSPGGNSTGRKILRLVDKITKSRYFQRATENEFIKRKIEEVSNTPLLLTVEVQELEGTLAVNIPPPPTDRIWYSFRMPPRLEMKVRPKLGEREVTFIHVTEWIEKKLQDEFQKLLVMPNMDDLYFPIMHSGVESSKQPQDDQAAKPPSL